MSFSFIQIGCSQELAWSEILQDVRKQHPNVVQLSTDSLAQWLTTSDAPQPLLIDIREKKEYEVSHLAGAIHMDPDTRRFKALKGVDKDAPIVVYCSVGYRSSKMAEKLEKAGFTNVSNLEGSIFTWANEGHTVMRGEEEVKAVHPYNRVWGMLLNKELRSFN
ncbi:MAG: rhodanese-like domain-containing protein [Bacteroidota bacterium]